MERGAAVKAGIKDIYYILLLWVQKLKCRCYVRWGVFVFVFVLCLFCYWLSVATVDQCVHRVTLFFFLFSFFLVGQVRRSGDFHPFARPVTFSPLTITRPSGIYYASSFCIAFVLFHPNSLSLSSEVAYNSTLHNCFCT